VFFLKEKHKGRLPLPVLLKIQKTKKLNKRSKPTEREKQQRKLSKLSTVGGREKTGIRKESQSSLGR